MKVTPIKRNFGKYKPGDVFELPDRAAKVLIKIKKLEASDGEMTYQTRAMPAGRTVPAEVDSAGATYDPTLHTSTKLKNSDGTWRKKPGRAAA